MSSGRTKGPIARLFARLVAWFYISEADVKDPSTHWTYLGICLFLVVTPLLLSTVGSEEVALGSIRIPGSCMSRELFGSACPGCGLTRSFVALTHGHPRQSLGFHRLGIALYGFLVWQVLYRLYCLRKRCTGIPPRLLQLQNVLGLGMVVALLVNWAVGLTLGGN